MPLPPLGRFGAALPPIRVGLAPLQLAPIDEQAPHDPLKEPPHQQPPWPSLASASPTLPAPLGSRRTWSPAPPTPPPPPPPPSQLPSDSPTRPADPPLPSPAQPPPPLPPPPTALPSSEFTGPWIPHLGGGGGRDTPQPSAGSNSSLMAVASSVMSSLDHPPGLDSSFSKMSVTAADSNASSPSKGPLEPRLRARSTNGGPPQFISTSMPLPTASASHQPAPAAALRRKPLLAWCCMVPCCFGYGLACTTSENDAKNNLMHRAVLVSVQPASAQEPPAVAPPSQPAAAENAPRVLLQQPPLGSFPFQAPQEPHGEDSDPAQPHQQYHSPAAATQ